MKAKRKNTPLCSLLLLLLLLRSHPLLTTSAVYRLSPPSTPLLGDARTYASGSRESSVMRLLSPNILPPVTWLLGSIVRTATRKPA